MKIALALALLLQDKPADVLAKSVQAVKAQKSMKVNFKAKIEVPNSDPLNVSGSALSVGEMLYIEYHASGGSVKLIVRRGAVTLEYNWLLEEWVDAKEMADPSAGRGLSNPNEVLDSLLANADAAKDGGSEGGRRAITIDLKGGKIRNLIKDFIEEKDVRWDDSASQARVELASDTLLPSKIASSATIAWKDQKAIAYQGTVDVESYGQELEYKFQEKNRQGKVLRDIPLTDDARKKLGLLPK